MYCHNTSRSSITITIVPANSIARCPTGRCATACVSSSACAGVTVSPLATMVLPRSTLTTTGEIASRATPRRFSVSASLYSRFGTINEPSISPSILRSRRSYSAGQMSFSDLIAALAVSLSRIEVMSVTMTSWPDLGSLRTNAFAPMRLNWLRLLRIERNPDLFLDFLVEVFGGGIGRQRTASGEHLLETGYRIARRLVVEVEDRQHGSTGLIAKKFGLGRVFDLQVFGRNQISRRDIPGRQLLNSRALIIAQKQER